MLEKLAQTEKRYIQIEEELASPEVFFEKQTNYNNYVQRDYTNLNDLYANKKGLNQ